MPSDFSVPDIRIVADNVVFGRTVPDVDNLKAGKLPRNVPGRMIAEGFWTLLHRRRDL